MGAENCLPGAAQLLLLFAAPLETAGTATLALAPEIIAYGRRSVDNHTSTEALVTDEGGGLAGTVGVVSICSMMMALGTVAMLVVKIPKKIEASTQNFSAGILVAAIAGELFPLLHGSGAHGAHDAHDEDSDAAAIRKWEKTFGMLLGFCLGLVLMFGQKALLGHGDETHHGQDPGNIQLSEVKTVLTEPTRSGAQLSGLDAATAAEADGTASLVPRTPTGRINRKQLQLAASAERGGEALSGASGDVEAGEAGGGNGVESGAPPLQRLRSDRMVSEQNVVTNAVTIVKEIQKLSGTVHEIISDGADATSRDDLDDELSEMHMYVGMLRRQICGAEPLSEDQHTELRTTMLKIDHAVKNLDVYLSTPGVSVDKTDKVLRAIETELEGAITTHIDSVKSFRRWQPVKTSNSMIKSEIVPWSLVIGVSIDCLVDGLMVGLTYKASMRAGYIMAFASSIESGFLGLSLSSSVYNSTASRVKHLGISSIPIFALQVGGLVAALMGDSLQANEAAFAGFITFAIVALLFLVTQELLITAHEITNEQELWYVNINLFLGAALVMFMEQIMS